MKSISLRPRTLAVAVATIVAAAGMSADRSFAGSPVSISDAPTNNHSPAIGLDANTKGRYIVRFVEQPLALYNSVVASKPINGLGAIPSKTMKNGRTRLDVKSTQALNYVQYLKTQQQQHLDAIQSALHTTVPVQYSMQHALNAVVIELTAAQVAAVQKVPGIVAVERDRPHALATDIGPGFIGAASLWWGSPAGQDTIFANDFDGHTPFLGDGMVIGDIDTGYNSESPSFQVADQHGYSISNPLGTGNFIGQCNLGSGATGISLAGCNDKVIGAYDEIDLTHSDDPFTNYSVEDTQGHGSHTASTAGGDFRSATLSGYTANISGVAPHANLVIYYACSPNAAVQCSTAATTGSVDQAIADGIVDALNYSISGGDNPWNDSTSLAFLSATDAGIFVAAAAGNTGASAPNQVPGTANHAEPWVTTVAASTHTGGSIGFLLSVNGAGAPGPVPLTPAVSGTGLSAPVSNEPIVASATYGTSGDACTAFTGTPFTGSVALLSYTAVCGTNAMAGNAIAAGADYVLIVANTDGPFLSGANRPKPVFTTGLTIGNALHTYIGAHAGTTINISFPASRLPQQPDELANFSLLGPVSINVTKPDVQAPGVNILASVANDGTAGGPNLVALFNGTSMATPHTTGSGALLMGLHPDWTPAEAKSALMMTAKEAGLTKADGTTPSDYYDRGSGRLQDFIANQAGLVMNETGLNFSNADPGFGGVPSALNLASMNDQACVNACSFVRKFHSTQNHTVTWTASVAAGSDPGVAVTVTPNSFPATANHDTAPVQFDINSSTLTADSAPHYAEVVLTPSDTTLPPLHLTITVSVPPPAIAAAPNPLTIPNVGAGSQNGTLTVSNTGGPTLIVTRDTTSTTPYVWSNQISGDAFGYPSVAYSGALAGDGNFYASDDFTITGTVPVDLTSIFTPGFVCNTCDALSTFGAGMPVHWRIYSDAGGKPSSDPDTAGPAVWSFDSTAGGAGVGVTGPFGGDISLNLVAAGQHTALPAGHYWLVVYPTVPCNDGGGGCTEEWFWLNSNAGNLNPPVVIAPPGAWGPSDPAAGGGFAMHLESAASCVPQAWLSASGFPLTLGGDSSAPITVTATAPLPGGATATGYVCLASNDANTPILPVQVNATGGTGPAAPTVAKSWSPTSVTAGSNSTATITLSNANSSAATLTANLVDTLPAGLVATAASATTTCIGGTGASVGGAGASVTLASGAVIPAIGSCTVTFTASSATPATYTNTIAVGALQTDKGSNPSAASAPLTVTSASCTPAQPIQDPGFEATAGDLSGNPFWGSTSSNFGNAFCNATVCGNGGGTANAHGGTVWMWLGGQGAAPAGGAETSTASQTLVIPSGASRFLDFWLWIGSVTNPATGTMIVKVDGTTVHSYPAPATGEAAYTQRSVDVSAFADGNSHTILFQYSAPVGESENYSLDDVTLDCVAPPIVAPRPATNPPAGSTSRLIH